MSVKLSEAILSHLYPSVAALMRADRSASASAISGEVTKSIVVEPNRGTDSYEDQGQTNLTYISSLIY